MSDQRCQAVVMVTTGTQYMVLEPVEEVVDWLHTSQQWIRLTSWTGSDMFPPETLIIAAKDIVYVQSLSETAWIYSKQATEEHYAGNPSVTERAVAAQERLVDLMVGQQDE